VIADHDDMAGFMEASSALDWSEPATAQMSHGATATEPVIPEQSLAATDAVVRFPEEWR